MVRAAARCAGVSSSRWTRVGSVSGWANMPARYLNAHFDVHARGQREPRGVRAVGREAEVF